MACLDVSFANTDLRKLCENSRVQQKQLGAPCARKLRARLSDMQAAAHVRELVAGRPHPLKGDLEGQFSLQLAKGFRLVFEPANEPLPRHADGSTNWAGVTSVTITYIGDYHD